VSVRSRESSGAWTISRLRRRSGAGSCAGAGAIRAAGRRQVGLRSWRDHSAAAGWRSITCRVIDRARHAAHDPLTSPHAIHRCWREARFVQFTRRASS
jgi:hypothetical protein